MHPLSFAILFVIIEICVGEVFPLISRNKRQNVYYLCGTYPNQYYSFYPCWYNQNQCTNGGRMIGVGCSTSAQCTPYYSGVSACINGCCCTVPNSPSTTPTSGIGSGIISVISWKEKL
uniref:Uncharacterized protein n=1 Tax=Panagrolaimus sp. PS1159 TaxID=55785 RepID=A0AC35F9T7_9BILA